MIKSFFKTGIGIATTFMSITFLTSCSNSSLSTDIINGSDMSIKESILNLEIPDSKIQLIGYKTIIIPEDERDEFRAYFGKMEEFVNNKQIFFDEENASFFIMYCPLADAIIINNGDTLIADSKGYININTTNSKFDNKTTLIGRKKTDNILGTGNCTRTNNYILFKRPLKTHKVNGKTLYYDLGIRNCSTQCSESNKSLVRKILSKINPEQGCENENVSCIENHGGVNCSTAFDINQGRCKFNPNVCMDYNGWGSDCIDGKTINFPGSDCFISILKGHCWNEIPNNN